MTISEDRVLDWYQQEGYDFFDNINYTEDKAIFDDDDIISLIDEGERFVDNRGFDTNKQRDNFMDLWQRRIFPEWEKIAKENSEKLLQELKQVAREDITQAKTPEERKEGIETLRRINPQSLGQLKTSEKRRAKTAFRLLFS